MESVVDLGAQAQVPRNVVVLLASAFAELRRGQTLDGKAKVKSPSTVLSTAELISVVTDGGLVGSFFGNGRASVQDCVAALLGTVVKENASDVGVLREYLETVVKRRSRSCVRAACCAAHSFSAGPRRHERHTRRLSLPRAPRTGRRSEGHPVRLSDVSEFPPRRRQKPPRGVLSPAGECVGRARFTLSCPSEDQRSG